MAEETTLVGLSRLKDVELFRNRIGSLVPSYSSNIPAGCLRISEPNTEVSKTEWSELYEVIGGEDGSSPDMFVLPYKPKDGDLEYYLVGKVLLSDIIINGNIVSRDFTADDLSGEYFIFRHGIEHTNPIIQVYDDKNGQVLVTEVINSVGQSKLRILGEFMPNISGVWKALATD